LGHSWVSAIGSSTEICDFLAYRSVSAYASEQKQQSSAHQRPMKTAPKVLNKRKHVRVRVQFRSHFSVKGPIKDKMVGGDGDLMDLSPGGCRIKSLIAVQPGTELELCIFPGDDSNPIMIDGAVVRWSQPAEFGLLFVNVRGPFLRRLTEVWRKLASPF
jgi:hypothetical protein